MPMAGCLLPVCRFVLLSHTGRMSEINKTISETRFIVVAGCIYMLCRSWGKPHRKTSASNLAVCIPHSDPKTCWIVCQKREHLVCNWFRWLNLNLLRCRTFFDRKRRRSSTLSSSVIYDRTEDQAFRPHLFIFMFSGAGDVINLLLSRRERSKV